MVGENGLHLIDFQSGRKGPAVYDVVSFLWQAKAEIPTDLRNRLIDCYISEALKINGLFCERVFCAIQAIADAGCLRFSRFD